METFENSLSSLTGIIIQAHKTLNIFSGDVNLNEEEKSIIHKAYKLIEDKNIDFINKLCSLHIDSPWDYYRINRSEIIFNLILPYIEIMDSVTERPVYDWDTNFVYISERLKSFDPDFHERLTSLFNKMEIDYGYLPNTEDIWCRDYMPIQLTKNTFLGFRYEPNYLKNSFHIAQKRDIYPYSNHIDKEWNQKTWEDAKTNWKDVWNAVYKEIGCPKLIETDLILDGGNVVLCENHVILTNKIITENSHFLNESELKKAIKEVFNGREPILIPWKQILDDFYGHSDAFIKFENKKGGNKPFILISPLSVQETESQYLLFGDTFYIDKIYPYRYKHNKPGFYVFGWSYINYLQVGNKIIIPACGIEVYDSFALERIKELNPDCDVRNIEMRNIIKQGGALHCITWNIRK